MALFKIEKGLAANLKTNRPDAVEGYCYFTTDDGKFYIDIATGTAKTPAENNGTLAGSTRMPINSYLSDWATRAKADVDGADITSTYGTQLSISNHTLKLLAKDSTELDSVTLPDEKVKQTNVTASSYTNWRPLVWGASNSATEGFTPTTVTDGVFTSNTITAQPSSGTIRASIFKGKLTGNADTATKFASAQKVKLTGAVTGEVSSQAGWEVATTLTDGIVATAKIANKAVTNAKLANSSITINGKTVSLGGSLTLSDIGLSSALRFIGVAKTAIVDGAADNTIELSDGSTVSAGIGDVVINSNNNQEYVWLGSTWEILGDESSYEKVGTAQSLINAQPTDLVLGTGTTFKNASSSVSFKTHTTKNVIGANATFTVTNPTIAVSATKKNLKATASGAAVTLNTSNAITALGDSTTASFVTSYPGVTGKLVTTTLKGVAGTTSVSTISSNTDVTATKISSYGTAAVLTSTYTEASETLVISWTANTIASGSDVTATKTAYSNKTVATANSSATTVATGGVSTSGTGGSVLTGLGTASTKSAITALGTPTTSAFATSINTITQPTIKLTTVTTAESGVTVAVMTGASASATGTGIAFNSKDTVAAITALGAGTAAAQTITVGTNDQVAAVVKS